MKHVISCRDSVYGKRDDAFRLLPDAGITHVELERIEPDDLEEVQTLAGRHGIEISTVGSGVDLSNDDSIAAYNQLIDAVARVGIKKLFTSISAKGDEESEVHMDRLREIVGRAAGLDTVICMETHPPFGRNADIALKTIREINSPALRMNFDTANIYYYNRNTDAVSELKKVVHLVASVHLKDTDGGYRSSNFPIIGRGVVDFPGIFRLCDEVDLRGPFTIELEGPVTHEKSVQEKHEAVKTCMTYLQSIGVV